MPDLAAAVEQAVTIDLGALEMPVDIQHHALVRWMQRVDPVASRNEAWLQLVRFVADARVRGRGPKWVPRRSALRGARYVSNPNWPHVVGLIAVSAYRTGRLVLLTVFTRSYDDPHSMRALERQQQFVIRRKTKTRRRIKS